MSLKDTFARGFVWKLAGLLALALFGWLAGMGRAEAHTNTTTPARPCAGTSICDQGEAYAGAESVDNAKNHCVWYTGRTVNDYNVTLSAITHNATNKTYTVSITCILLQNGQPSGNPYSSGSDTYSYGNTCTQRTNQTTETSQLATEKCVAGCKFKAAPGYSTRTNQNLSDGTTATIYRAVMEWTGDTCTGGITSPQWSEQIKPREQECTAAGSGQSYCVKKTGENCYTAASGRMICWTPGETGQKTDGSMLQVAASGNSPPPAPLAPPPAGQSWVQGPGTTNVTNVNNNGVTNVTNITNFTTSGGAPAGSTNSGEGNTGQSGDGQCTSNCSTGVPGGTGTNIDLTETNGLLAAIKTATEKVREFFDGIGNEAGTLDTSEGDTQDPVSIWGESPNQLDLDASGFGMAGGGCPPAPSYMGYSLDAGGNLCMFASIIGALVLAAGYVQAAYIIGRA